MQNGELVDRLRKIYACNMSIQWILANDLDLESAWYRCNNFSWLIWFIEAIELDHEDALDIADFRSRYDIAKIKDQLILVSDKTYKEKDL